LSESKYIGRGEVLTENILYRLLQVMGITPQVNIEKIVLDEDYEILDQEIKNHNFDFVMSAVGTSRKNGVVIEVNYKHKEKAAKKWRQILVPMIERAGYLYLTINHWDCRKRGLFWLNSKKEHPVVTWDDVRDIIDALETAGIHPEIRVE